MSELNRQPNLLRAMLKDLWRNKQQFLLLIAAVVSAFCVVWATHHTRMFVEQRELLMMSRDELNVEWRHLLIEQNALAEHSRIESIAKKRLDMHRPKIKDQVVIRQ
ncbi:MULTISPECIES: cell division protein FtsL [unclassified Agarivorans]|uniref:cell division protein FtsL n=1 Tax=unclassified Agarivorans TaxID=2636026 RepID=UPI0010CF04F2|nr:MULTISPECIES: cell division protein FtsL [unclassified Agarivorans]MDO6686903.1 cell division protein FtsL [Agarivorans sp. 3_MG-2023]MDO6716700.1 cell division protein FtsL [Agarivorans sp. 2_MG-2023]MDO6764561.1 cell division protein FtsL [Agarivorans sp. 1_MG-2023]GDY26531.1 cell division protein FtsL [Agarivorans sp. Toyoura001]